MFVDFKAIPVGCLLKCEDDLMVQKYGVTSSDLLKELLMVFQNRIFNPKTKIQTFEPSDFIDNFSSIIDTSGFIINKDYKSYNLCDDLSVYGHVSAVNVTASDPLLDSVVSCGCDIDHSVRRPFYGQDLLRNGHVRFFLLYNLYIILRKFSAFSELEPEKKQLFCRIPFLFGRQKGNRKARFPKNTMMPP